MKEAFKDWNPSSASMGLLNEITIILEDYETQGYILTLRQLYYQLVSRDVISNTVKSYNRIGNIVSRGRLAGYIDWSMIEDRVRTPVERAHWDSPLQIMDSAAQGYYTDRWKSQSNYVEVWCEKDAVSNIIEPVCREWDVLFMANRGYSSQSAMYEAAERYKRAAGIPNLLYLGDHDPSGIDMIRDVEDRLDLFEVDGLCIEHLALTKDQIQKYNPPENPAKITDSRYENYVLFHGDKSWELDALEPSVLSAIVNDAIEVLVDQVAWNRTVDKEEKERGLIRSAIQWVKDNDENL